jgi:glycosyltransferase involved in cell wall biosynthesis
MIHSAEFHRMRVVIFVASLGSGGAERVAVRVAGWLLEAGHEVSLLTLSAEQTDFYRAPQGVFRTGLDLQRPSRGLLAPVLENFRRWLAVRRFVRERSADVVLSLGDRSNVLMLLATIGLGCRLIISERADPVLERLSRGWSLLRRLTYPLATLHVSQSTYASDWMKLRFPSLPCRVIGNAGDLVQQAKSVSGRAVDGPLRLIAVGRLSRQKGVDILLEAFSRALHRSTVRMELVLVGDGEDREVLQVRASELGLNANVRFIGRREDVDMQMRAADVFVLPSRSEGFPNALIEAMSIGLPVIAARCRGGVEDILGEERERYGLEFLPGDVKGLVDCILRLAGDADLRGVFALRSLQRAADYSPERIAAEWREVVEQQ